MNMSQKAPAQAASRSSVVSAVSLEPLVRGEFRLSATLVRWNLNGTSPMEIEIRMVTLEHRFVPPRYWY